MSEDGEFRGAGHFRIDRAKALEKLSAFQLERGADFLLPLARCAAAAEARSLVVKGRTALKAAFDGTPFTRAELADPYGALFIEGSDPRRRHFAAFLLGALRTRPREVTVVSGPPEARFRLLTRSLDAESVEPGGGPAWGTTVLVRWGPTGWFRHAAAAKRAARRAWAMTPEGFTVDGSAPGLRPSGSNLVRRRDHGGLALRLTPPSDPAETEVVFCSYGVAVETIRTLLPGGQVRAWVNDDAFALTASQSAVVEDVRRQKALDAVGAAAAEFLPETARRLAEALPEGRLAAAGPEWTPEARSWFAATVRRLCDEKRPIPTALYEAPFLIDARGCALSLAGLRRGLPPDAPASFSTVRTEHPRLLVPVAYCPRREDRALLESVFSGALHDATQLIESLAGLK